MWNPNIRPHGESFALRQAITSADVAGNQANNNPMRLDQSQGGTSIRVVVSRDAATPLAVPNDGKVTLTVRGRTAEAATPVVLGTAVYTNDSAVLVTLNPDTMLCEFILPQNTLKYPYIDVLIGNNGTGSMSGTVDIFPHQVSHPRR